MKKSFNVSVKTQEGYRHFEVPEEVYIYIKQLESCIKFPDVSKLKEKYGDRFS